MNDYFWYIILAVLIIVLIVGFSIQVRTLKNRLAVMTQTLDKLNHSDELTGISNRRHFDEVYQTEFKRAKRRKSAIAAILIDVDFFKGYNNLHGYQQGDACLKAVTSVLTHTLKRETDIVCRYDGDAFVALLPDTSSEAALHIAELLRDGVAKLNIPHGDSDISAHATISLGVASMIPDENNDVVKQADEALSCAKIKRNAVCLYDATHQKWLKSNFNQT